MVDNFLLPGLQILGAIYYSIDAQPVSCNGAEKFEQVSKESKIIDCLASTAKGDNSNLFTPTKPHSAMDELSLDEGVINITAEQPFCNIDESALDLRVYCQEQDNSVIWGELIWQIELG